ncbi:MAG TPA: hypothetical protein DEB74_11820 [Lachnospiraceae bacterium]|nr:hypothetical protein [Lachnospiraceae bacterium]
MEHIRKVLLEDYERVCKTYNTQNDTCVGCVITENDVLRAHYLISDYFLDDGEEVVYGVKNYDLLSSAVHRQVTSYGNVDKWTTNYQKMATLLYGLVKNHAFHDGNKRTALLVLLLYMDREKLQLRKQQSKLETLVVRIAANTLDEYGSYQGYQNNEEPEIMFIADLLKHYTSRVNKRYYPITFAEFNQRLNRFNVKLDNPKGNYIGVYQYQTEGSKLFGLIKGKSEYVKIFDIGFPGWKRQINPKALKETLKAAHLTPEYGIDSEVFYNGEEPMYTLINEYREPLARLKDE